LKIALIVVGGLAALVLLGWFGLQVKPAAFPAYGPRGAALETIPIPSGLPAPVDRFYRELYGERVPVIESAVITGRLQLRLPSQGGVVFPGRFRFVHLAGRSYRHYIEATLFGVPFARVNEHYLDGHSRAETPFGNVDDDPKWNQAANLGLWAETAWFPAVFLTDERVRWEAVDPETALLVLPFESGEQRFLVRFDPAIGLMTMMEAMRYKGATGEKVLWIATNKTWSRIGGMTMAAVGTATWLDEGTPWAVFTVEDAVYNTDVSQYVTAKGS
jgi:hypothetical protein